MKEHLLIFLKGLLMGFSDVIPGVSGGTIAFITGIYDRLIEALKNLGDFARLFIRSFSEKGKSPWKKIDFKLFVPLGLGIGLALLAGSHAIPYLLDNFPGQTYSFFVGLILASAYFIYRHIRRREVSGILFGLMGFVIGGYIATRPIADDVVGNPLSVFLLGVISICAMILPGISGSYILLMFGHYEFMLEAIKTFDFAVILLFGVGAVIGLLGFSRLLSYLLKRYHDVTFEILLGLMLGALYRPTQIAFESLTSPTGIFTCILLLLVGIGAVLLVEQVATKKKEKLWA